MKLKHAALIHSWAEGAKIEFFSYNGKWQHICYPSWLEKNNYRIKLSEEAKLMDSLYGTVHPTPATGHIQTTTIPVIDPILNLENIKWV